jgi:hypothetical protein
MTLYKWVRDYVETFSFINRVEFKKGRAYFFYTLDGKEKNKMLPYRANKNQLLNMLERIKTETNYYENEEKKIKEGHYKVDDKDPFFYVE